jgi:hypothetical protein
MMSRTRSDTPLPPGAGPSPGSSVSDVVREAIAALVEGRRRDDRFRRLLEDNLARHRRIFDLLREDQP